MDDKGWSPVMWVGGGILPPHGVCIPEGTYDSKTGCLKVKAPTKDNEPGFIVNGETSIAHNDTGKATANTRVWVNCDSADGLPAVRDTWGVKAGSTKFRKGYTGVVIQGPGEGGFADALRAASFPYVGNSFVAKITGYSTYTDAGNPVGEFYTARRVIEDSGPGGADAYYMNTVDWTDPDTAAVMDFDPVMIQGAPANVVIGSRLRPFPVDGSCLVLVVPEFRAPSPTYPQRWFGLPIGAAAKDHPGWVSAFLQYFTGDKTFGGHVRVNIDGITSVSPPVAPIPYTVVNNVGNTFLVHAPGLESLTLGFSQLPAIAVTTNAAAVSPLTPSGLTTAVEIAGNSVLIQGLGDAGVHSLRGTAAIFAAGPGTVGTGSSYVECTNDGSGTVYITNTTFKRDANTAGVGAPTVFYIMTVGNGLQTFGAPFGGQVDMLEISPGGFRTETPLSGPGVILAGRLGVWCPSYFDFNTGLYDSGWVLGMPGVWSIGNFQFCGGILTDVGSGVFTMPTSAVVGALVSMGGVSGFF